MRGRVLGRIRPLRFQASSAPARGNARYDRARIRRLAVRRGEAGALAFSQRED